MVIVAVPHGKSVIIVSSNLMKRGCEVRCQDCIHHRGYKAGMIWEPYVETCNLKRRPAISNKGFLYNRKCKEMTTYTCSAKEVDCTNEKYQ